VYFTTKASILSIQKVFLGRWVRSGIVQGMPVMHLSKGGFPELNCSTIMYDLLIKLGRFVKILFSV
jgi:hypothetical protein